MTHSPGEPEMSRKGRKAEAAASASRLHQGASLVLLFASGFAGLVYEVLWMRELALLFGSTAQAAATTLAAFFLGLVAGARFWGRRAAGTLRPLAAYAGLEACVAVSALLYFLLLDAYHAVYADLFQLVGDHRTVFLTVKFLLAVGVLFLPSFCMGGTLPMMGQHLIRRREALGRVGSALYAVNTLGAATGAYAAGFHLPRLLGFDHAYLAAISITGAVAVLAWILGREAVPPQERRFAAVTGSPPTWSRRTLLALAAFSGFATLALEVLWTRMFAQVLQNSVYTFSTILVTFLLALALGAALAGWLIRKGYEPAALVPLLLTAAGLLVAVAPLLFYWLTDGMRYFGGELGFGSYVLASFRCAFTVMLVPGIAIGCLFPYLLRVAEPYAESAGRTVGDLSAVNTLGAVAGSVTAGFVLLDLFGLWASLRLVAVAYLCVGFLFAAQLEGRGRISPAFSAAALLLLVTVLDPSRLPVVHVDPVEKGESVLRTWEGSSGIISVIRQPTSLSIKMDNDYSLGGTGAAKYEEGQAHLPLWLHADPESVFFLGMGTGITAGAALAHPVERVVVSELSPDVVAAARTFFGPWVHGLFEDPRVVIVAEDGRNYLFGAAEEFDVVIADLFMTWKAGVGDLYSREHYEAALARLEPGGIYVQWLPLYQVSRREFCVVGRTLVEVFPLVTLWRGAIAPGWETAALIGHREDAPLDRRAVAERLEQSGEIVLPAAPDGSEPEAAATVKRFALADLLVQYAGNLTAARELVSRCPVNSDDRPVIEYEAPRTHRRSRARGEGWFVGGELIRFLDQLLTAAPPEEDPYLRAFAPAEAAAVRAGLHLYASQVLDKIGDHERAWKAMEEFERLYSQAGGQVAAASEEEQSRREIEELIAKYEERIRGLRRHLREAEEADAGSAPLGDP